MFNLSQFSYGFKINTLYASDQGWDKFTRLHRINAYMSGHLSIFDFTRILRNILHFFNLLSSQETPQEIKYF